MLSISWGSRIQFNLQVLKIDWRMSPDWRWQISSFNNGVDSDIFLADQI